MPDAKVTEVEAQGSSASGKLEAIIYGPTEQALESTISSFYNTVTLDWHPDPEVEEDGGGLGLKLSWSLASSEEL